MVFLMMKTTVHRSETLSRQILTATDLVTHATMMTATGCLTLLSPCTDSTPSTLQTLRLINGTLIEAGTSTLCFEQLEGDEATFEHLPTRRHDVAAAVPLAAGASAGGPPRPAAAPQPLKGRGMPQPACRPGSPSDFDVPAAAAARPASAGSAPGGFSSAADRRRSTRRASAENPPGPHHPAPPEN